MAKGPMWAEARQDAFREQERRRRAKAKKATDAYEDSEDDDDEDDTKDELKSKVERHFGKAASRVLKMVNTDNNTEGAVLLIQRALLSSTVTALTQVEETTLSTSGAKGIYAFNALISQIRELLSDIQGSQDTERIATEIGNRITLSMRSMAEAVLDQHHTLKRELQPYLSDADVKTMTSRVDATSRSLATYISHIRNEVQEVVRSRLCD